MYVCMYTYIYRVIYMYIDSTPALACGACHNAAQAAQMLPSSLYWKKPGLAVYGAPGLNRAAESPTPQLTTNEQSQHTT